MPILIASCLILQLNLDLIIHMIFILSLIFVESLIVKLVLDNDFLDQKLLIGGIIYHLHCLMFPDDLTFHGLHMIIYLMFDLLCIVFLLYFMLFMVLLVIFFVLTVIVVVHILLLL